VQPRPSGVPPLLCLLPHLLPLQRQLPAAVKAPLQALRHQARARAPPAVVLMSDLWHVPWLQQWAAAAAVAPVRLVRGRQPGQLGALARPPAGSA
jgi:hypothetical protein